MIAYKSIFIFIDLFKSFKKFISIYTMLRQDFPVIYELSNL